MNDGAVRFTNKVICFLIGMLLTSSWCLSQLRYELNSEWKCKPSSELKASGEDISMPTFALSDWLTATVPGTVLTTLLNNKKIPDPFFGMNNELIPDIYSTGREHYTYWFVRDFKEITSEDEQAWLLFRGVNYAFDAYLNGQKLNDSTAKGMFMRRKYNITSLLKKNGSNRLAVLVYPPDPVGNPNGGQGGDGRIAKNLTHQYVAGWDWIQPVRDRNTGIWDKVFIEKTRKIDVANVHFVTNVPGKRIAGGKQAPAIIKMTAEVENALPTPVSGTLRYIIAGKTVQAKVNLPAKSISKIMLPDYTLEQPKLWWPNGYGTQHLYDIKVEFVGNTGIILDKEDLKIGVREIQTSWNSTSKSRAIHVNGQPIFITGGNWIISDAMLRFSKERYDAEVRFHRDMNLNLIRIWGGALTERPEFYEACDKYGMLVFQDFWFSGDCNGRWKDPKKAEDQQTRRKYPDDHSLVVSSLIDQIKMIRNHASLAIYCGGNEITPPDDILAAIRDSILPHYDTTRYFFDYSNSDSMSLNTLGGNGDGPYTIQDIKTFWGFRTWPFNSEIGSVGVGEYESLERFIPKENLEVFPTKENVDSVWKYHKYIGYNEHISKYGEPKDTRDFARKAQLVNYDQYRALIEGFSSHMWNWYTGVIIWKTQNPWTALRGEMYDYHLDPNGALYGLNKAGEKVHIMYDPVRSKVMISNHLFDSKKLTYHIAVLNVDGRKQQTARGSSTIAAGSVQDVADIKEILLNSGTEQKAFLHLKITDENKRPLSENLYWLADSTGNFTALQKMKPARLSVKTKRIKADVLEVTISNSLHNPISFFNRVSLVDEESGKRLLPTFYSDNYFSLLPGESKRITVEQPGFKSGVVKIEGWNSVE